MHGAAVVPDDEVGRFPHVPVVEARLEGVLVFQMPIDRINAVMQVQAGMIVGFDNDDPGIFEAQLRRCAEVHDDLVVLDLRDEEIIYAGNRFVIYALFPQCRVSMHVLWGLKRQNTVFAIGKSILDRTSPVNVGDVCLEHGGGGHGAAGTCQVPNEEAERVRDELIRRLVPPRAGVAVGAQASAGAPEH